METIKTLQKRFFDTGETVYTYSAFKKGYDYLHMVAYHEMQHRNHVLEGLPFTGDYKTVVYPNEEYRTYITCYKNQGLFPHHMFSDLGDRINSMGSMLNRSDETFLMYSNLVDKPWWWFIYKIPRRW